MTNFTPQALTIVDKSAVLGDWWTIELYVHSHREWLKPEEHGFSYQYSGRIADCDVEGTSQEMLEIAKAIEGRGEYAARRCAVKVDGEIVYFWSPRNSREGREGKTSIEYALDLAKKIRETIKPAIASYPPPKNHDR